MIRPLRYSLRMISRARGSALLRSGAVAVAAALTFFVLAQSSTVRSQAQDLAVGGIGVDTIERATISLTIIAVIVGALQVGVLMTRVVLQRMQEIGVLKAAGISSRDIFLIFLFESLIYGFAGGVIGCLAGLVIAALGPMPGGEDILRAFVITVALSTIVATLAGLAPARRAVRAPAVEAINHAW